MKKFNEPIELIIKKKAATGTDEPAQKRFNDRLKKAGIETEPVSVASSPMAKGKGAASDRVVLKTNARDTEVEPWDMAHISLNNLEGEASYIEPNLLHEFVVERKVDVPAAKMTTKSLGSGKSNDDYDPDWNPKRNTVWHLGDDFSQLKSARDSVAGINYVVRIGHLDTGYSQTHFVIPDAFRTQPLQRNFIDGEEASDAHDRLIDGFIKQPGHGTGTLGLLAGTKIDLQTEDGNFNDYLGGAPFAEVICCRVAKSVVLLKTNAFSDAIDYLTQLSLAGTPIHVVSMSMGGAPSRVWADSVNAAYEAGITMVTAAGNNFAGLPTRHVVYPARFGRVIAACGVTHDYKPYYTKKATEMQGCFGPKRHMDKALSAFTPNTPWASVESGSIRFSGAGTSSATPQIAAAAAIYYRKYHQQLDALPEKWQRVEAIRNALYSSAIAQVNNDFNDDFLTYFGNGILQANAALNIPVPSAASLTKTPEDEVPWFPILNTLFKAKPNPTQRIRLDMFNTELSQLVYNDPQLRAILDDERRDYEKIGQKKWKQFRDAIIQHPSASMTLRKYLEENAPKR